MNFNFILYKLNADITDYKDGIRYLGTDNSIDLYKVRKELRTPILGIQVSDINLYFFEGSLITVYIHIDAKAEDLGQVRQILESRIKEEGKGFKIDSKEIMGWENNSEFLGLIYVETGKRLYLYYTLKDFSIYNL